MHIGVVYSRLRVEEKWLFKALESRGVSYERLLDSQAILQLDDNNNEWSRFDAIIISATSEIIPEKLLQNLKSNGKLIMPKKYHTGNQKLLLIKKKDKHYIQEELFPVKFVPLLNKMPDLNLKL